MHTDINRLQNSCKVLKLLYIEDDEDARNTTVKMFKHFFDEIFVAKDGNEGMRIFEEEHVDLVISDINMPKKDGLQVLQEVRELSSEIPFLLLSAHSDNEYFLESISLGVDYFILKPVTEEQLYKALLTVVKKIEYKKLTEQYQEELENELEKRTKELVEKLYNDDLTGLGSRYAFFEDTAKPKQMVVYLIDIDNFHVINDIFGHEIGTSVLKDFGQLIETFAKGCDAKAYRLSGDEFALMKEEKELVETQSEALIKQLYEQIKKTEFNYGHDQLKLHVHIGVSFGKDSIFEQASIALDYAKAHATDYLVYSSQKDRTKDQHRILKERHTIQNAIDNDGIVAVYQAIVDREQNICKYEMLMRLKEQDTQKLVTPFHFLSTALMTGLYDILSVEVIKQGLKFIEHSNNVLSFNFTYRDIVNTPFLDELETFFQNVPDAGKRTVFEITENESMESYDIVKSFINRFRKYGIRIAIDDFGTGFSNFSYILEMEPDYLKIDGSLIHDIDTNTNSLTLTEAIINFSKKLGIKVIAEFVHSEKIFLMLKELGVDEFQGYYFAKPIRSDEIG